MRAYRLNDLSDAVVMRNLDEYVAAGCVNTAIVLAHIAEVDVRRLYVPAGYPSMFAYCVGKLHFSEDAAYKRIRSARACRGFPALFDKVADGRLHLAAVCLLASHLTQENAGELMAAATHRTKSEIEQLLARRFPQHFQMREQPATLRPIAATPPSQDLELAPGPVGTPELVPGRVESHTPQLAPGPVQAPAPQLAPGRVEVPERYELRLTISKATREKLQHAQELLSHCVPSGDMAQVMDRALDALIAQLEKRKCGAGSKPREGKGSPRAKRCIPAHVRRAVWQRDGGRCTFVGDDGHRCGSRKFLEFDHIEPVARGGEATVAGVRLRCRPHNQYEAEQVFGAGFMHDKRIPARVSSGRAPGNAATAPPS